MAAPSDVRLRPVTPADEPFLRQVYASTRAEELALVPWTDEQKEQFIEMQFRAQSAHFATHFAGADHSVIERDRVPIGRLWVERKPEEIHVIDIALLPAHRGGGVGTMLLKEVQAEGAAAGTPVTIFVERFNPAQRLYRRLGFVHERDEGVYFFMRWQPGTSPAAALPES